MAHATPPHPCMSLKLAGVLPPGASPGSHCETQKNTHSSHGEGESNHLKHAHRVLFYSLNKGLPSRETNLPEPNQHEEREIPNHAATSNLPVSS